MTGLPQPPQPNQPAVKDDNSLTRSYAQWFQNIFQILNNTGGPAPAAGTYIVQTSNALLPNAQVLSSLSNGFLKVTNGTGAVSSTGNVLIQSSDLSTTGVTANTYGSATQVGTFTVDTHGRITAAANVTISGVAPGGTAGGDLSGTYPNPTVAQIQGVAVSSTNATAVSNLTGTNSGDQTITLTGNVTGSGTGSFSTTIAAGVVTNSMLAGSITASKLVGTDITTVGTITSGTWTGTTIAVLNGGTGVTTSTGTGSNVLSNGPTLSAPVLGTPASGNLANCTGYPLTNRFNSIVIQSFTGNGTYTPTSGMVYCIVELVGGGGAGGGTTGSTSYYTGAGGGGAGAYAKVLLSAAQIGASKTVTIGAAGAAAAAGSNAGGSGGTTSIGSTLVSCTGGSGGGANSFGSSPAIGGAGGSATVTTGTTIATKSGDSGGTGIGGGTTFVGVSGAGASSNFGAGGLAIAATANSAGNAGTGYGSGGSGGATGNSGTSQAGSAGTAGYIVITEFVST